VQIPFFDEAEIERARRYHRPLYAALLADTVLGLATLAALTLVDLPLPWWAEVVVGPALVLWCTWLVGLPLSWWRYRHERRWGFSTQSPRAWAGDRLRGLAVGEVLTVVPVGGLLALAHLYPHSWPWRAAFAGAALALFVSFVAPVMLEPVFNRFRPLEGPLAGRLSALAERAGVPVREVLVSDASRRTRKVNAYVSGIGRTRRVVVWDTFLESPSDELEVVVAHELGHRRMRHVLQGTLLGMGAAVVFVAVLRPLRPHPEPSDAAFVLLLAGVLELAALPVLSALSRRWERAADRFSLLLTRDGDAFQRLHRRLATSNLADLDPPKPLYYWVFTHPTPPQRLVAAKEVLDRQHW
jgi:STE24 endopeptidase